MLPFHFFYTPKPQHSLGLVLSSLSCFPSLLRLDISFCNLLKIPEEIGDLRSLVELNLGETNLWRYQTPSSNFPIFDVWTWNTLRNWNIFPSFQQ